MRKSFLLALLLGFLNASGQSNSNQYFEMSKKYMVSKNFDQALSSIDDALQLDSLNRTYVLHKVKVLYYKSDCESSLVLLNKLLTKEKKFDDETISYFCDLADCLKESKEASEILKKYVEKKRFKSNEMIIRLAQRLYLEKDYEKSIYYYKEYIKLNLKDVDAIIDLARIIFSHKGSEEGIRTIKDALDNNKNNIALLTCLSNFYFLGEDYQKALEVENQIIKLDNNVTHIGTRAMLYEKLSNIDKAYEDNLKVISLLKCNSEYYYTKVLQYEFDKRLFEDVVKHSLELIDCNKSYETSVIDGLYTSLFFCGDFERGKIYLDKKIATVPDNFNPYYFKLLTLFKDKKYDDILKYLELAAKTKDIDSINLNNINLLKFSYYLIKEDYEGFVSYWKSGEVKSLDNNLNFTLIEGAKNDETKLETNFDKETGIVKTTLIIPTKIIKLLGNKYNFKVEVEKYN